MVKFSHIAEACAAREAAMTEDERAELQRKREATEKKLAERFERMLAPMGGFQSLLDRMRIEEESMASLRLAQAFSGPELALAKDLAATSLHEELRRLGENPLAKLTSSIPEGPTLELSRRLDELVPKSHLHFPQLEGLDRLRDLTANLSVSPMSSTETFASPAALAPLRPPRDADQDERFGMLTEVVVAQTGQVVELRREVREVREFASRDSHRDRLRSYRSEREGARLQWWHMAVASVLSAVLGALATKFIVGG